MAIPDYQFIMRPILELAADGEEYRFRQAIELLAQRFGLSGDERQQMLPSKTQPVFDNRVGWARTYLVKAGLLESARRGYFKITDRGRAALSSGPEKIDAAFLRKNYEEFREFIRPSQTDDSVGLASVSEPAATAQLSATPEEVLEAAYQGLRRQVESELLRRLQEGSASFFEQVVVRVLVAMGYGGSLRDAGAAIGRTGDEGIDGIIKEDPLGLDAVYVQAKKWKDSSTVGRPEIQKFAGALQGQRARKGVFITTSTFSAEARQFVAHIESKIVLIDGQQLAQFMFEHNVAVAPVSHYEIKKVDADFFDEEQ